MIINQALLQATALLAKAGVDEPRLDATLLLGHALAKSKEFIFTNPEYRLAPAQKRRFFALVKHRARREPFAYITGRKEFYGLDFTVNRAVLIPRPETELIIETVANILHTTRHILPTTIIDVGTGSGVIAVTLAKLLPHTTVYASDTSPAALRVARKNAKRHGVYVNFCNGDLIAPIIQKFIFDPIGSKMNFPSPTHAIQRGIRVFIVANLPYLTTAQWRMTQPEIKKYEPRGALDGGPDGLRYYRVLIRQIKRLITHHQLLITTYFEIDPRQVKPLSNLIHKTFPTARVQIKKDLAGRNRVLVAIV